MIAKASMICAAMIASPALSDGLLFEDFMTNSSTRWDYVSDQVMGGVSDGQATFVVDDTASFVRLTGAVSTDNNGGFIQVRRLIQNGLPEDMQAVHLQVRGNGQQYYLHIRTSESRIPWFYYQAAFTASSEWSEITLPLGAFKASTPALPAVFDPVKINSLAIVAYGRNHAADVSVSRIEIN